MKRRDFLKVSTASALGLMLGCQRQIAGNLKTGKRPNILFIMTDQQHAGMMSCAGNQWVKTPALDGLAASGIRFERAYCCNPVCVPSRFSLQTGRMPSVIGMGDNADANKVVVPDIVLQSSLGNVFQSAGYETVYGGKVHLPNCMNDLANIGYRNLTGDARQYLAQECANFIKGPHDKPFLLFASFINPHDICYMAVNEFRESQGLSHGNEIDWLTCKGFLDQAGSINDLDAFVKANCPPLPSNFEIPPDEPQCIKEKYLAHNFRQYARSNWTENRWRLHRWVYARLTETVDKEIGIVLSALRDAGLEEETLVVFTSDHGDMDSAHRLEHKNVLYEESVHIPFLMSYKGVIKPRVVDNKHLISNGLDLLPTLCDYAGIKPPAGLYGNSVRPIAEGKSSNWPDFVAVESAAGRMVRTDHFKYSLYDSGTHREQLIDLESDHGEMHNLADLPACQDVLNRHRRLLRKWVEKIDDKIAAGYIRV